MKEQMIFCVLFMSSLFDKDFIINVKDGITSEILQEFIALVVVVTFLALYKRIFKETFSKTIERLFRKK